MYSMFWLTWIIKLWLAKNRHGLGKICIIFWATFGKSIHKLLIFFFVWYRFDLFLKQSWKGWVEAEFVCLWMVNKTLLSENDHFKHRTSKFTNKVYLWPTRLKRGSWWLFVKTESRFNEQNVNYLLYKINLEGKKVGQKLEKELFLKKGVNLKTLKKDQFRGGKMPLSEWLL